MSIRYFRHLSIAVVLTLLVAITACSSNDDPLVFTAEDSSEPSPISNTETPRELPAPGVRGPGISGGPAGPGGPPAPFWRALDYSATSDGITFGVEKFTLTSDGLYIFYSMTSEQWLTTPELVPHSASIEDHRGVSTESTRITHLGCAAGVSVGVISLPFIEVDTGTLKLNISDASSGEDLMLGNWSVEFVQLLDGDEKPHGTDSMSSHERITSDAFPGLYSGELIVDGLMVQNLDLGVTRSFHISITPEEGVEPLSSEQITEIFGPDESRVDRGQPNPIGATATPIRPRTPTVILVLTPTPRPTLIPAPAGTFTGVHTPEDMQAQADTWPDDYRIWVDEEMVILFAYPHPILDWVGPVFIKHIPSFSSIVINFDGDLISEHIGSEDGEAAISAVLANETLMAEIADHEHS